MVESEPSAKAEFSVSMPTRNRPIAVMYVWSVMLPVVSVIPTTSSGAMCWITGLRVNGSALYQSESCSLSISRPRLEPPPHSNRRWGRWSSFGNSLKASSTPFIQTFKVLPRAFSISALWLGDCDEDKLSFRASALTKSISISRSMA